MWQRMARTIAASAVMGAALLPSSAGAGGSGGRCPTPVPAFSARQVLVFENCYAPNELSVITGDSVRWDALGEVPHTVTFETLDSGAIESSFYARFNRPVSFPYRCAYHPGMAGVISVSGPALGDNGIEELSEAVYVAACTERESCW